VIQSTFTAGHTQLGMVTRQAQLQEIYHSGVFVNQQL
jgi:hypothetical protein